MADSGNVTSKIRSGIATVRFSHPQSNSLPGELLRTLAKNIVYHGNDDNVRVIVLESEGSRAFCAGASFDELIAIASPADAKLFFSGFALVINAIRNAPKFVIARVQGKAVGGGVGLAAAADYTIAHTSAEVKLSELAVGIGPFVVGPAVERKIGKSAFATLSINATTWHTSEWAYRHGLYSELHSEHGALDAAVEKLAERLDNSSPEAMKHLKRVLWEGTGDWDTLLTDRAAISGNLVLSDYSKNAIGEFKKGVR